MTRNERELKAVKKAMFDRSEQIQQIWKKADDEDRAASEDERLEVEGLVKEVKTVLEPRQTELEAAIALEQDVKRMSRDMGPVDSGLEFHNELRPVPGGEPVDRMIKTIGEQLTESAGFKAVQDRWSQGRTQFSSGAVEIETKAGTITGLGAGGGGALIPVPQVVPGVVETLFQRRTVADLVLTGQASGNSIRYIVEGTATSGVAGVAEAGMKPDSTLGLTLTDEPVKKLATKIVVSDELLDDVNALQSYVNGRLTEFILNAEENSLLLGAGTNDLVGFMTVANTRGISTLAKGASDNNAEAIFKGMNGQRGSSKLEPDWIIMHPDNWQTIRLLRDGTAGIQGQYFGGGPFNYGPYGSGGITTGPGQVTGATDYMWNKPVYVTSAITKGTALIGTRSAAQIYRRGGVSVEATNSGYVGGVDLFSYNLLAIRAEERLALCVYRPSAFTAVNGLS